MKVIQIKKFLISCKIGGDYILLDTNIEDNRSIFLIPLVVLVISILLVTTYTIRKSK